MYFSCIDRVPVPLDCKKHCPLCNIPANSPIFFFLQEVRKQILHTRKRLLRTNQDACKYYPFPPRRTQRVSTKVYPGCTEDGFTIHLSPFRPSIQAWGPRSPGDGGGGGQCTLQASLFLLPSLASRFSFRTKAWEESGERRSAENRKRPEGGGVREKMATFIMCGFWIMPLGECQRSKALSQKCLEPT